MPLPIKKPSFNDFHAQPKGQGCGVQFEPANLKLSAQDTDLIRKLAHHDDSLPNAALLGAAAWLRQNVQQSKLWQNG